MRKLAILTAVLLWCAIVIAQTAKAPESVTEVNLSIPKPGMEQQFEQGRKRHSDFHRAQNDTWTVLVYQVATGDHAGSYVSVQPGRSWKDFDSRAAFDKLDAADVAKNMGTYSTSGPRVFLVYRPDLSLTKEGPPARMATVTHFYVMPEHIREFEDGIKGVNAAIQKTNYPAKPSRWYQLVSGAEGPQYVLVTDRTAWADLEPPAQRLDEALGADGAQALAAVRRATKHTYTDVVEFRPDLSYIPAAAAK